MSETKFTAGPWTPVMNGGWSVEPDDREDTGSCAWQQIAADGKTVAIAVDGNPGWGSATPRLDANVRLIAAAPAMHSALTEIEDTLRNLGSDADLDALAELARAALSGASK